MTREEIMEHLRSVPDDTVIVVITQGPVTTSLYATNVDARRELIWQMDMLLNCDGGKA